MFCHQCGKKNPDGALFCCNCGTRLFAGNVGNQQAAPVRPQYVQIVQTYPQQQRIPANPDPFAEPGVNSVYDTFSMEFVSPKSRTAAFLLAFFLGGFGAHNFYTGHIGKGVFQLLAPVLIFILGFITGGVGWLLYIALGIWIFVEWIVILCGGARDGDGKPILTW